MAIFAKFAKPGLNMRVEQALTLLNLEDDCFHVGEQTVIKKGNTLSFVRSDDNVAFAKVLNPYIKTAEGILTLTVAMPSAKSRKYSSEDLEKIAATQNPSDNLDRKVQKALIKLSEENKPMPTIEGIKALAAIFTNGYSPDVINMKFAQWGGHGNMTSSQAGRGSSMYGFSQGSDPNGFDRWQANTSIDAMMDLTHRGDPKLGFIPTEKKLETAGFFNHQYADENAAKYDMTWTERLTKKSKDRLIRMLKEKEEREQRESEREPKKIRLDADNYNPRAHTGIEYWLEEKRGANPEDYLPKKGRLEEWTPEWYDQLSTLRKQSDKISQHVGLKSLAYYMAPKTRDTTDPSRRPSRRDLNDDPYNKDENPMYQSMASHLGNSDSAPDTVGSYGSGHDASAELDAHEKSRTKTEDTDSQVAISGTTMLPEAYDQNQRAQAQMPLPAQNNVKEDQLFQDMPLQKQETIHGSLPMEKQLELMTNRRNTNRRTKTERRQISDFGPDGTPNAFNQTPGVPGESGRHMAL